MNYIKTEFKKLFPVSVIIFVISIPSWELGISLVGLFLLAEHMYSYGRWDIFDILGHENLGIILILVGFGLLDNWIGFITSFVVYLLFANYIWEDIPPLKYALTKIMEVLNGKKN